MPNPDTREGETWRAGYDAAVATLRHMTGAEYGWDKGAAHEIRQAAQVLSDVRDKIEKARHAQ